MLKPTKITIYTDGSCVGNPGAGGWGVVLQDGAGKTKELAGGFRHTTNNRMELIAAIKALENVKAGAVKSITLISDSRYVVDAFKNGWVYNWEKKEWTASGKARTNTDLWKRILELVRLHKVVKFEWVRGHTGVEGNEQADKLALDYASRHDNPPDEEYERTHGIPQYKKLTHTDATGAVKMVDVGAKPTVKRHAVAQAEIIMQPATLKLIRDGNVGKGDVIATARIAAISAAKRTDEMIPLCHQIPLDGVDVDIKARADGDGLTVTTQVKTSWKTGVEMEALLAASVAALTIYDMCKAADKNMRIENLKLNTKTKSSL